MPYVPPTGNAVVFDFTGPPYVPPPGNAVLFDFVAGTGGPGTTTDALPFARRLPWLYDEEQWVSPVRRRFAPAEGYGGELQPPHLRHQPLWLRFYEEPEHPRRRRRAFADAAALYRRKRAAQIIG